MPDKKLLIMFDCDGTLADSHGRIVRYMQAAWEENGFADAPTDADIRKAIGLKLEDAVRHLSPNLSASQIQNIAATYVEHANHPAENEASPLFAGMSEVIEGLLADGHQLGVATGMGKRGLKKFLSWHGLLEHFSPLKTADCGMGKPHPDILHQAMAETATLPSEVVMIGDSIHDVSMAKAAGVHAIGVTWGYESEEILLDSGADKVLHNVAEILTHCREFAKG